MGRGEMSPHHSIVLGYAAMSRKRERESNNIVVFVIPQEVSQ